MRRRSPDYSPAPASVRDEERFVWHLVGEAQAQRALAAADSDMHDVKALGMLGIDGAVILGLTAARSSLPRLWWIAVIALVVCVPFFLWTVLDRSFSFGPRVVSFYDENARQRAFVAGLRLLADLNHDMAHNRRALAVKATAYSLGFVTFVIGALFATAFLLRMAVIG